MTNPKNERIDRAISMERECVFNFSMASIVPEVNPGDQMNQMLYYNHLMGVEKREHLPQPLEIERKFLLDHFPIYLENSSFDSIEQGYILISENEEVRVRHTINPLGESSYILARKTGSGLVRTEEEAEIQQDAFDILWGMTEGRRIKKKRYYGTEALHPVTIDRYEGDLEGLIVAEAEFESEEQARKFQQPYWTTREVTGVKGYGNRDLAVSGMPQEQQPDLSETPEKIQLKSEKMAEVLSQVQALDSEIQGSRPILIGVGGRTSAGKTTAFISSIQSAFPGRVSIISTDDSAKGAEFVEQETREGRSVNYDHPNYYDTPQLRGKIDGIKRGEKVTLPVFNFKKGKGEPDGERDSEQADILIVEGLYALSPDLIDLYDIKAFVDISLHGSIMRRLMRDIHRTNQSPNEILRNYLDVVEPMYQEYICGSREDAEFVIENEYDPDIESDRAGMSEQQVKFNTIISDRAFNSLGAQLIAVTRQDDIYFEFDKDTGLSGESLRIRREGGANFLGYKGPLKESAVGVRSRNIFEARISDEDAGVIIAASGREKKRILKNREIRVVAGIEVMIDTVRKIENGQETELGNFIEFHLSDDTSETIEKMQALCDALGIEPETRVDMSYSEM